MIKLLRKVRQNLLFENELSSYLLYASGEIVLVVIGILIALSINNWNEDRKNDLANEQLLQQLYEENTVNINELLDDQSYRDTLDVVLYQFHKFLKEKDIEKESETLKRYLADLLRATTYSFSNNNLKNYINSNVNTNSLLTKELVILDASQIDLTDVSEMAMTYKLENFYAYLENDIDFENLNIRSYELLKSLQFRNRILMLENFEEEVYNKYDATLSQQQKVDSLISLRIK